MTDELPSTIDLDAHTIRRSIHIDAPIEKAPEPRPAVARAGPRCRRCCTLYTRRF